MSLLSSRRRIYKSLRRIAFTQSCHSWWLCPVVSLLELSPTNLQVPATHCFRPVLSLLDPSPSHVTPGTLADEFTSPSGVLLLPSHVTPGAHAQSCHSWSSRRRIYKSQRLIAFAQSSHSCISCPVMSLLQHLSSRVTPGVLAGEFLSSRGV